MVAPIKKIKTTLAVVLINRISPCGESKRYYLSDSESWADLISLLNVFLRVPGQRRHWAVH